MTTIDSERRLYAGMWGIPEYAEMSPGERYVPVLTDLLSRTTGLPDAPTALDAGCGSGKGSVALANAGFRVIPHDFVADGFEAAFDTRLAPLLLCPIWQLPDVIDRTVDVVYCTDVLEHLPTEFVGLTIQALLAVATTGVFLTVSLQPDGFGVLVGEPLHKTVREFVWWRDLCRTLAAEVIDARDLGHSAILFMRGLR